MSMIYVASFGSNQWVTHDFTDIHPALGVQPLPFTSSDVKGQYVQHTTVQGYYCTNDKYGCEVEHGTPIAHGRERIFRNGQKAAFWNVETIGRTLRNLILKRLSPCLYLPTPACKNPPIWAMESTAFDSDRHNEFIVDFMYHDKFIAGFSTIVECPELMSIAAVPSKFGKTHLHSHTIWFGRNVVPEDEIDEIDNASVEVYTIDQKQKLMDEMYTRIMEALKRT